MKAKVLWWWVKRLNMLTYFRNHIAEFGGLFYLEHPAHFSDHFGYREKVKFISYDEKKKEFTVKRTDHRENQKSIIVGVKKSQLFIHAK